MEIVNRPLLGKEAEFFEKDFLLACAGDCVNCRASLDTCCGSVAAVVFHKKAEDGTVTTNETAELLVYGGVLIAILLIGGFIGLRKCTRREIFFSASLLVGYNILKNVLMMSSGSVTGAGAVLFSYLHTPVQWTVFPTLLLIKVFSVDLTNSVQSFLVGVPAYFVPYIFMLFGKQSNT